MTKRIIAVLALLTLSSVALAEFAPPAHAAPAGYVQTFNEDFSTALSRWSPKNPKGVWKSNFSFNPSAYDLPHSRSLPDEKQLYLDKAVHGVEPLNRVYIEGANRALTITIKSLAGKTGAKFVGSYADSMKPAVRFKKPFPYGSGLLSTEKSFSQTYGYFEARMALPCVKGGWPAFWLYGQDGDEIDVVENMGVNCQRMEHNVHFNGAGLAASARLSGVRTPDMPASFDPREMHTYGVDWRAETITFYIDGKQTYQTKNPGLHKPMYLVVNYAVGGWGGNMPEDPKIVGSTLKVDWVRAYRGGASSIRFAAMSCRT